jgi:cell division protein FtsB
MANNVISTIKKAFGESKVLRMVRNKYVVVSVFFLVWVLFIDTNNIFVWINDLSTVKQQERQKVHYKEAIQQTDEKLKELTSNKDSLEKFAREQYLFHQKDEEVFIITPCNE